MLNVQQIFPLKILKYLTLISIIINQDNFGILMNNVKFLWVGQIQALHRVVQIHLFVVHWYFCYYYYEHIIYNYYYYQWCLGLDGNCYAIDGWGAVDGILYPNHYLIKRLLIYELIKKKGLHAIQIVFVRLGYVLKRMQQVY